MTLCIGSQGLEHTHIRSVPKPSEHLQASTVCEGQYVCYAFALTSIAFEVHANLVTSEVAVLKGSSRIGFETESLMHTYAVSPSALGVL